MPGRPPRAEGVLEQEPDHVVLGEQLGHRPEVRAADLALRGVDLVLLVLLPELVDPAQRVVGSERLCRDARRGSAPVRGAPPARGAAGRTGRRAGRSREGSRRRSARRRTTRRARPARRRAPRIRRASPARWYCGWSSRPFSARNRANSSRCHCSYAHSATSRSRSLPNWRHFARSPLRRAACAASRCSGRRSANTPRLSMAARDAASAARRAASTDVSSCFRREEGRARMAGLR